METKSIKKLTSSEKTTYGLGAVAKDMVYMLSANYILYYYQDIMGVSAWAMGTILLVARIFDAFNDPVMGVIVSKTKTRWGKFRPWLMIGTLTNAVILYLMFSCPPTLSKGGLVAYAACSYILWGVTYTMMDIPYWSMIPAFTKGGKERESLSAFARAAAGVGSAIILILTVLSVSFFGMRSGNNSAEHKETERRLEYSKVYQRVLLGSFKNTLPDDRKDESDLFLSELQTKNNLVKELAAKRIPQKKSGFKNQKLQNEEIQGKESLIMQLEEEIAEIEKDFLQNEIEQAQIDRLKENVLDIQKLEEKFANVKVSVERAGYRIFSLIVAVIFIVLITLMCFTIKEKSTENMKSASVKDMFNALVQNDQAMTMVAAIVCINTALYMTSNLLIYFFKYDYSPTAWESNYTLFNMFGGAFQILAMMILFALFRRFMDTVKIFYVGSAMAFSGYAIFLIISFMGTSNFWALIPSAFLIMSAIGLLNVVVTVFLANSVDYGELKNGRRDEAVIFSMQTFVVKLASGFSAMLAGLILSICNINKDAIIGIKLPAASSMGLRMCITLIPMTVLIIGALIFKKRYILTDKKVSEITEELISRHANAELKD